MDIETVSRYVDAVGDETFDSPVMRGEDSKQVCVPAMAVAAISVRGVVNDLQIPGGTLHLGQELQFLEHFKRLWHGLGELYQEQY